MSYKVWRQDVSTEQLSDGLFEAINLAADDDSLLQHWLRLLIIVEVPGQARCWSMVSDDSCSDHDTADTEDTVRSYCCFEGKTQNNGASESWWHQYYSNHSLSVASWRWSTTRVRSRCQSEKYFIVKTDQSESGCWWLWWSMLGFWEQWIWNVVITQELNQYWSRPLTACKEYKCWFSIMSRKHAALAFKWWQRSFVFQQSWIVVEIRMESLRIYIIDPILVLTIIVKADGGYKLWDTIYQMISMMIPMLRRDTIDSVLSH